MYLINRMTKLWGPPTWFLFHTLAEKIKEDKFDIMKNDIINMIKRICRNLPCPDCSGHATHNLNNLKINMIRTKGDLKQFLWHFHNLVNAKTRKQLFKSEELDNRYKLANTNNIVQYFVQTWSKKSHNPKMMTEELHKTIAVKNFIEWWKTNYIHFNL